jgi:hypothetical protein
LSQNEIDAASLIHSNEVNTQRQRRVVWPETSVVARAYLDQLARSNSILPERADTVRAALDRADQSGAAGPDELAELGALAA